MAKKKPIIKNNNIRMSVDLAEAMRNVAATERRFVGAVWEDAARAYLAARMQENQESA